MILTDTGPLVALIDPNDPYRAVCLEASRILGAEVMVTTWQCFTEVMHFLGREGGHRLQDRLWDMRRTGRLEIHSTTGPEADRMADLMRKYQDTPMDLADSSLIAMAESRSIRRVFTLDEEFYIYVLADGSALEVAPLR